MTLTAYTEGHLILQLAILLSEHNLSWDLVTAYDDPPPLKLRWTGWAGEALKKLTRARSALSPAEVNHVGHKTLQDGVEEETPNPPLAQRCNGIEWATKSYAHYFQQCL